MCVFWCGGTLDSKCVLISTKSLMFAKSVYQHPLKYETWFTFLWEKLSFLSWSFCQLKKTGLLILLETYNFTHWSEHCWLHLKVHCDSSFLKGNLIFCPSFGRIYFRCWMYWAYGCWISFFVLYSSLESERKVFSLSVMKTGRSHFVLQVALSY